MFLSASQSGAPPGDVNHFAVALLSETKVAQHRYLQHPFDFAL